MGYSYPYIYIGIHLNIQWHINIHFKLLSFTVSQIMHVDDVTRAAGYHDSLRMLRRRLELLEDTVGNTRRSSNRRFAAVRTTIVEIRVFVMALETEAGRLSDR